MVTTEDVSNFNIQKRFKANYTYMQKRNVIYTETKEGIKFKVLIRNGRDQTFLGCPNWRGLAKAYMFEVRMKIEMYILGQPDLEIMPRLPNLPVLPPCMFL